MESNTQHALPRRIEKDLILAKSYIDASQLDAAAAVYRQLLERAPNEPHIFLTLGLVYLETGCIDAALFHIGRSVELDPTNAVAYRSMGDALAASKQYVLAVKAFEKSLQLDPHKTETMLNLSNAFHALGMNDQALNTLQKIIRRDPNHLRALNNLGKVNHDMGRMEKARVCYDRCVDLNPEYAEARFNRAALLLSAGDYEHGWKEYEWRFKRSGAENVYPHRISSPRWQGEDFKGRRLLVHCEQGMGDVLQFVRYLPIVKQRGGTLILEVHAPLVSLLEGLEWVDEIAVFHQVRPPVITHDIHIPLLSLPAVLGTPKTPIAQAMPYIRIGTDIADSRMTYRMKNHINIGLVWASSPLNPGRNLPIEQCRDWFKHPRLHFVSLQTGELSKQIVPLKQSPAAITTAGDSLDDFLDTAKVMANLDLMISVDTAAAHLAGALGKPLWVLLPFNADWRWSLQKGKNPWYPEAKFFRQPSPGNWKPVIRQVAAELHGLSTI